LKLFHSLGQAAHFARDDVHQFLKILTLLSQTRDFITAIAIQMPDEAAAHLFELAAERTILLWIVCICHEGNIRHPGIPK
jgi:hypothetical protein